MASSAGLIPRCLVLAFFSIGLSVPGMAQQANDRCEGTLCDLYYGSSGNSAPPPSNGATPLTVPKAGFLSNLFGGGGSQQAAAPAAGAPAQPEPARTVPVGGGLIGMMHGAPQERCGGSLCDLFYGGPSPEEQREAQRAENPGGSLPKQAALAPSAAPALQDEPRATRRRGEARERGGVDYARAPTEKPGCVAPAGDPWRCYRK